MTTPTTDASGRPATFGEVTDRPLDLAAHEAAVADRRAGAVVSFQGWSATTTTAGR